MASKDVRPEGNGPDDKAAFPMPPAPKAPVLTLPPGDPGYITERGVMDDIPAKGGGPLDGTVVIGVPRQMRFWEAPSGNKRWEKAVYERMPDGSGGYFLMYRGMR